MNEGVDEGERVIKVDRERSDVSFRDTYLGYEKKKCICSLDEKKEM